MSTKRFTRLVLLFLLVLVYASSPVYALPLLQQAGDMDIDGYCRYLGYNGSRLDPKQQNVFGWGCKRSDGTQAGMDLYGLCKWQYQGALPYPEYSNYNDPKSWFCSSEDLGAPAPRPPSAPPATAVQNEQPPTQQGKQLDNEPTVDYPGTDGNCGNALYAEVDENGHSCRVIDGLYIWSKPDNNSPILGPVTDEYILAGPSVCNQGYRWYPTGSHYSSDELVSVEGWKRESGNTSCFSDPVMQPATPQPTIVPTIDLEPDLSQPTQSNSGTLKPTPSPETEKGKWCSRPLDVYDLGGGKFWDKRFYIEIPYNAWDANQDHIRFYYKGTLVSKQAVDQASGLHLGDKWRFGVSTLWSYFHWNWKEDSNWMVETPC